MKQIVAIIVLLTSVSALFAQNFSDNYIRDFRAADSSVKQRILESSLEYPAEELEELYIEVLEYVLGNAGDRINDQSTRMMYRLAVDRLVEIGDNRPALRVWNLFELDRDTSQRQYLLEALQVLGQGAPRLHQRLNAWILARNSLARSGTRIDAQVLGTAIDTVAALGDPLFIESLLHTVIYGHPAAIDRPARAAIAAFPADDRVTVFSDYIPKQELELQIDLLDYVWNTDDLAEEQKAAIAAAVLRVAVGRRLSTQENTRINRRVRLAATEIIRTVGYQPASDSVVEHFNLAALEYERRVINLSEFIDALNTLGSVGTAEASRRLTRYLEYMNTQTQNDRPVSTQLMLAVVNNLRDLAQPDAYNALFYATMLDYPTRVQTALQEAIQAVRQ